jgi:hypothetical protein
VPLMSVVPQTILSVEMVFFAILHAYSFGAREFHQSFEEMPSAGAVHDRPYMIHPTPYTIHHTPYTIHHTLHNTLMMPHSTYTLHTLCIHSAYTLHTLCIHSAYTIHTLCIHSAYTLHTLCIHYALRFAGILHNVKDFLSVRDVVEDAYHNFMPR